MPPSKPTLLMFHQLFFFHQTVFFLLLWLQCDASRPLPDSFMRAKGPFDAQNDGQPGGRTLRHFFDDWPKPLHDTANAATNLSISMPGNGNPSSEFSLKLGTSNGDDPSTHLEGSERDKPQINWGVTWGTNPVAPMGGPLAEVLRSSTSNSSPTSVLHRPPRPPASEASY